MRASEQNPHGRDRRLRSRQSARDRSLAVSVRGVEPMGRPPGPSQPGDARGAGGPAGDRAGDRPANHRGSALSVGERTGSGQGDRQEAAGGDPAAGHRGVRDGRCDWDSATLRDTTGHCPRRPRLAGPCPGRSTSCAVKSGSFLLSFPRICPRAALRWHLPAHKELGTALVQRGRIACVTVGPGRSPDAVWMAMPAEKKNRQS